MLRNLTVGYCLAKRIQGKITMHEIGDKFSESVTKFRYFG